MKVNKNKIVLVCIPVLLSTQVAHAVPVPGGTLDPLTIPKYVTPLVIPPVMNNARLNKKGGKEYDIAVRQFKQQILPGGIWDKLSGRSDGFPATTIWSYGPKSDPVPDSSEDLGTEPGVAPATNSQFNYPAYTIENTKDQNTTVNWINDLVDDNGDALPHLFAVDQSLHWANPLADCSSGEVRTDCMGISALPYEGPVPMVTHVHGAHVGASGDGYTEAWWLPDAENIECVEREKDPVTGIASGALKTTPTGLDEATGIWNVACEGGIANQLTNKKGKIVHHTNNPELDNAGPGVARMGYPNDQPSTTLWYHDHSLGMTRLNVMAGPAGFWLIRDSQGVGGETGLTAGSILPAPAPVAGEDLVETNVAGRHKYREIPIVIQGRSFNTDGSLFYPDNRAFFEGLNVAGTDANGGQFGKGAGELQIDMDPATSDIAPIWNTEAFFNTMVVNGVTWPKLEVAPAIYRFRLLNGSNSRFINLAMPVTDAAGNQVFVKRTVSVFEDNGRSKEPRIVKTNELRFWQIGAEQSLKPTVTAVRTGFATTNLIVNDGKIKRETPASTPQQALLMGLAERADVLVDFRGLPDGTIITMTNTAPDAPFGGFPDIHADADTTGQVMRFVVNHALLGLSPSDELHPKLGDTIQVTNRRGKVKTKVVDETLLSTILNPDTAATSPWNIRVVPAALDNFTVEVTNPVTRELALYSGPRKLDNRLRYKS
ncbi:MAG: hypothetical protein KZQ64_11675 [gamma proteobacterium symbiont of Bathyaustriella thionipta]|nr:hypothetical protein [gamma proteobacterium symbiont of Bathyaustriella thionipta]MCU7949428.1 hypothetical protein [gamma proteobacterium symbiont of Bathyaustriella thionipta]MCU7954030.1 hypothetical protein [gamma proteobacterium symbiont of Bathyaustriella thionipta]MCU7956015.1 hypothetical protein [gamma proteobacterium symbiont of Bathyaustriella thionipta]MCU7967841.1 hypothetical protein [gamma proteobacterium symbiont of Bathyaustriella thionipta]